MEPKYLMSFVVMVAACGDVMMSEPADPPDSAMPDVPEPLPARCDPSAPFGAPVAVTELNTEGPDYTARLSKYLKDEYPSSWAIQGYTGIQFLAEAIKKANSTDSDKVAKALLGLTIETPIGPQTIREKDHQANRGQLYGKTVMDPKYPFPIMKPVTYVDPTKFMD